MKNLTIKKVALGLFIAGFTASSAYAVEGTASSSIQGNKPVMYSKGTQNDHTMTLRVTTDQAGANPVGSTNGNKNKVKVGDWVHVKYDLHDVDGDEDTSEAVKATLEVYIKKDRTSATWDKVNNVTFSTNNSGEAGEISFQITSEFAGAEVVGYRLQEKTTYGLPDANEWLYVNDIWANTAPDHQDNKVELDTVTGGPFGPGDTDDANNGTGPIEGNDTKLGIFKTDASGNIDRSVNYTVAGAPAPKYGERFAAVVWNDDNGDELPNNGESEKTANYTITWTLSGTYAGVTASNDALTATQGVSGANGDTILLGDPAGGKNNTIYATSTNGYQAGAQGFNLKATGL
ncbi:MULTISPECIES: hypothetical protein [unclassified Gilliamella]|uniref:hypothetical protein n=1 Tax=unclassified Gilliamella TaxID=2685620 RepID=UPI001C6A5988|nr:MULTISPECIES: hypothetical protein [unclassified Gilliamella]MCX8638552.1 hypothetical protein [Gilliamella sp. B3172]QYN47532.1 hypothetical protein GYM74_10140 [Gilliamella sp. ESL0405]